MLPTARATTPKTINRIPTSFTSTSTDGPAKSRTLRTVRTNAPELGRCRRAVMHGAGQMRSEQSGHDPLPLLIERAARNWLIRTLIPVGSVAEVAFLAV